ncbi:MAG: prenyltransferase/squalene oxidase repeat-containing protein [Bacillota bacterium]
MSAKVLWKERLLLYELGQYWVNQLPLALSQVGERVGRRLDRTLDELGELVARLDPSLQAWYREHLQECLEAYVERRKGLEAALDQRGDRLLGDVEGLWKDWLVPNQATRYDEFYILLRSRDQELEAGLAALPAGPAKAREALQAYVEWDVRQSDQVYDAMVLLEGSLPPMTVEKEVADWKQQLRAHEADLRRDTHGSAAIFWRSRDNNEIIDAISRYRFMEHFQIGEFPTVMREIEYTVGSALLNGLSGFEALSVAINGDRHLLPSTTALFLASRSAGLCARIRHFIEIALVRLAHQQFLNGDYTDYVHTIKEGGRTVGASSTYLTAMAAVCLLRLARQQWQRECGVKAVKWLVRQQRGEGYWVAIEDGQERPPDLMTTVLALEAIKLSGDKGLSHSQTLGERWLTSAQRPTGEWGGTDNWPPYPFETVLVLEYLSRKAILPDAVNNYLKVARGFLGRASELALEDDLNAWRLSLVIGYQALEAFLYGILTQPSINAEVFRNKDQTIGGRKALDTLEEYLKRSGILPQHDQLPCRSDLNRLAHLRDEVIHKAVGIPAEECQELLASLRTFVRQISVTILGESLV